MRDAAAADAFRGAVHGEQRRAAVQRLAPSVHQRQWDVPKVPVRQQQAGVFRLRELGVCGRVEPAGYCRELGRG